MNRRSSPGRDRPLAQVDVVDDDPPLPEEPQGRPRGGRVVPPEDLDVGHLLGRDLAERGGHVRRRAATRSTHRRPARSRRAPWSPSSKRSGRPGTIAGHRRCLVTVWFTVQLDDRPGSLARVATALGGARREHHRDRRRRRGHRWRADAHDLRRRPRRARRSPASGSPSRSTTRPAASSPTACRSTTCGPARPVAARSAERRTRMPRRRAAETAAIRFDVVDRRRGDRGDHRRPRPPSAAGSGRSPPSATSTATRRSSRSSSRSRASPRRRWPRRSTRSRTSARSI